MKSHIRRAGVVTLALVICLSTSPVASAAPWDRENIREKIGRFLKKIKTIGIVTFTDQPSPPKP